ncbi:MAG: cyclic nucleotide-binding domain-containing protein, partial [Gammaproteobacteria bacterium]
MNPDIIPPETLEAAIASFRRSSSSPAEADALSLSNWGDDEWNQLFRFTSRRRVLAGEALIRRGESGRTLYFVLQGKLEVIVHSSDGLTMG